MVLLAAAATPAQGAVLWHGDFETGDLTQWDTSTLVKTGDRDNLVIESDQVAQGDKAAQITLRPDIIFEPYNQSRVEVAHFGLHTQNGEDSYFAWSFLVPADAEIRSNIGYWESMPSYRNTMTFFIEPAMSGGTSLVFGTGNLGETRRWTTKLELGVWHRLAIHNHWSQDTADGKVDVWYDGNQVVSGATATKYNADKLFFQMGLHRSDPAPPVQVIYIDAAIEADSAADMLQPLPGSVGGGGNAGAGGASMGGSSGAAANGGIANGGVAGFVASAGTGAFGGASGGATFGGMGGAGTAGAAEVTSGAPLAAGTSGTTALQSGSCGVVRPASSASSNWLAVCALASLVYRRRKML